MRNRYRNRNHLSAVMINYTSKSAWCYRLPVVPDSSIVDNITANCKNLRDSILFLWSHWVLSLVCCDYSAPLLAAIREIFRSRKFCDVRDTGNFRGKIFLRIAENMSFGGIYFGGWASLSAIMIFITKWLIKRAGNLTGPWASFHSARTKSMMKCNWKVHKSLLRLILTVFVALVFTATVYTSFGSPCSRWQTIQLFSHLRCTKLFGEAYAAFNGELHADYLDWRV